MRQNNRGRTIKGYTASKKNNSYGKNMLYTSHIHLIHSNIKVVSRGVYDPEKKDASPIEVKNKPPVVIIQQLISESDLLEKIIDNITEEDIKILSECYKKSDYIGFKDKLKEVCKIK